MLMKKKFARVPEDLKTQIMSEYLTGEITQRELGDKYNFHYRRIAEWFKEQNRYDEYLLITKQNQFRSSTKPMGRSKLKISKINLHR